MGTIKIKNIHKHFGKFHALKGIDLTIHNGEFMTLLGPSGCGKTTFLRILAGLEDPSEGDITIDDKEIVCVSKHLSLPAAERNLNLVFQSYALWPHLTVFENVAFGLKIKKMPKETIKQKVQETLERLQIAHLSDRSPGELSGGQQQRVAIARAIVTEPKILLLDEPLSNLDAKLRIEMRSELKRLHHELKTTIVYVTHDQVEALTLSTRIAVFFEGKLVQVDTPQQLYKYPQDLRVAQFIGNPTVNCVEAKVNDEQMTISSPLSSFSYKTKIGLPTVTLATNPENIEIVHESVPGAIKAEVYSVLPAGSETYIQVKVPQTKTILSIKEMGEALYEIGSTVWIKTNIERLNIFDPGSNGKIDIQLRPVISGQIERTKIDLQLSKTFSIGTFS
ncbi:ABC transporter ATP-binding protein [Lederbergia galactosidilytica]|uniref:ABC transporter n=1 Tax=Lederbergia galactosidilytica TaxID=217031 RepID=A0A177ZJP2_9BACI|nr:ABC transporter ATP-binding protein [Lederbergia galactosidilytica]OAK67118.1 ABC transporter [Lederbergia galactosidilytica]